MKENDISNSKAQEFLEQNWLYIEKFIQFFRPKARLGHIIFQLFLFLLTLVFYLLGKRGIFTNILYLGGVYTICCIFYNIPSQLYNILFPPLEPEIHEKIHHPLMIRISKFIMNLLAEWKCCYQSVFIRHDLFTISFQFIIFFFILWISKAIPLFYLIHFFISASYLIISFLIQRMFHSIGLFSGEQSREM